MFLTETRLIEYPAECLRRHLKMDHKYIVHSDGRSGALILFWKKDVHVSLRHKAENYIGVFIGTVWLTFGDGMVYMANPNGSTNILPDSA